MTLERLSSKLMRWNGKVFHWCPACDCAHGYEVPRWKFDGNVDAPSFEPSMLIFVPAYDDKTEKFDHSKRETICHYYVRKGQIEYCGDSPHKLKGKTVPLPDFPAGYNFGNDGVS